VYIYIYENAVLHVVSFSVNKPTSKTLSTSLSKKLAS